MSPASLALTAAFALIAFAANSLLCRLALQDGGTDAASFTALRLVSAALVLVLLVAARRRERTPEITGSVAQHRRLGGHWRGGFALFAYAGGFSIAYVAVGAATGALLLFGAVQATMLLIGLWQGERLTRRQWAGFALAIGGLLALLLPGAAAPPFASALWMLAAGVAWGLYSLWGRGSTDPVADTAGNFVRTLPFALVWLVLPLDALNVDARGVACALASGAITSGLGYVLWYRVLPMLGALRAAALQLAVPPLAGVGGLLLLHEALDATRVIAGVVVLGGIAIVLRGRRGSTHAPAQSLTPERRP
jgi:drug/metabolite transporter (DMT)-like permease